MTLMPPETARAALLQHYPALQGVSPALLDRLCAPQAALHLPAGTQVFTERQPCQGFPLLLAGSIRVVKLAESGRELLLYRVEPGGSCIISSGCLLGNSAYNAQGLAESALELRLMPTVLFQQLIAEHAPFRDFVFHLFAERIAELMQLVEEVAFSRLDQRLARLLLGRTEQPIHTTHQQLAEELGSVREIISRLLKGFATQGLVTLGREQIVIQNRMGLMQVAGVSANK